MHQRQDTPPRKLNKLFIYKSKVKSRPRVTEEHDGVTSLVAAVEAGRGLALVPSCLSCMVGARLKLIPLRPSVTEIIVAAVWKPEALTPALERFISLLKSKSKHRVKLHNV